LRVGGNVVDGDLLSRRGGDDLLFYGIVSGRISSDGFLIGGVLCRSYAKASHYHQRRQQHNGPQTPNRGAAEFTSLNHACHVG
jgi:hypothetical protein